VSINLSPPAVVKPPIDSNQLSTAQGDNTHSTVGTGRLNSTYERAKALPANIDTLIKALDYLKKFEGFTARVREPCEYIRYLPLIKSEKYSQWSYLDSKTYARRELIAIDGHYNNLDFTLLEFARRDTEKYQMCVLYPFNKIEITNNLIYRLVLELAEEKGVWRRNSLKQTDVVLRTLKHTWATPEQLLQAVLKKAP